MKFSQGKKLGDCLTGRKKEIDRHIIILVSPVFFFLSLCQLPFLSIHQHTTYPLKIILFSALLSHVQSRLNGNLVEFTSSGKSC